MSEKEQKALSTKESPLNIFVDGSARKHSEEKTLGYGAYLKYEGKEYKISDTHEDAINLLSELKEFEFSNPTMEMLGLLKTLQTFQNSSEHINIWQDYTGAVNYGKLWEYSEESLSRENHPWKAKKPYIKVIVAEIEKCIIKLLENGGSLKIYWIPGHITPAKIKVHQEYLEKLPVDIETLKKRK